MWYEKCTYQVEFSHGLIQDMPRNLRDIFDEMSPENTPPLVFEFMISCIILLEDFRAKLDLLKKARANNSGWLILYLNYQILYSFMMNEWKSWYFHQLWLLSLLLLPCFRMLAKQAMTLKVSLENKNVYKTFLHAIIHQYAFASTYTPFQTLIPLPLLQNHWISSFVKLTSRHSYEIRSIYCRSKEQIEHNQAAIKE